MAAAEGLPLRKIMGGVCGVRVLTVQAQLSPTCGARR